MIENFLSLRKCSSLLLKIHFRVLCPFCQSKTQLVWQNGVSISKTHTHGLVVIAGDSRSRGREFESQYRSKLDGLFLALIPCEICSLKRLEIHLSNILGRMNE